MSGDQDIPEIHRAIVSAAVRAALGERAVVRQIVEMPATLRLADHVVALHCGIRTFWQRWTARSIERGQGSR
jgi:hypothetical protein